MRHENSLTAQRRRILDFLRIHPLDTLTARKELDVMHPAGRVMELRKQGIGIITTKIKRRSDCGKFHRVACYVLAGAAGTAPTLDTVRTLSQENDKQDHSTEVKI